MSANTTVGTWLGFQVRYLPFLAFAGAAICFAGASSDVLRDQFWSSSNGVPKFFVAERVQDLGEVSADRTIQGKYLLHNKGNGTLAIEEVKPGCGRCVEILYHPREIRSGAKDTVHFALVTDRLHGDVRKTILVRSNDPSKPALTLTIIANVSPASVGTENASHTH